MTTKWYLSNDPSGVDPTTDLDRALSRSFAASPVTAVWNTLAGPVSPPVSATQLTLTAGGTRMRWLSPPLTDAATPAGFTLSGTITLNIWAGESGATANVTLWAKVYRADNHGVSLSVVDSAVRTSSTELAVGTPQQVIWARSPTSTVFQLGDRLGLELHFDDAVTPMTSGHTASVKYNGNAAAGAESYIQITEDVIEYEPRPPWDMRRSAHVAFQEDN